MRIQKFGFQLNNKKAKGAILVHPWLLYSTEKFTLFSFVKDVKYIYVWNKRVNDVY